MGWRQATANYPPSLSCGQCPKASFAGPSHRFDTGSPRVASRTSLEQGVTTARFCEEPRAERAPVGESDGVFAEPRSSPSMNDGPERPRSRSNSLSRGKRPWQRPTKKTLSRFLVAAEDSSSFGRNLTTCIYAADADLGEICVQARSLRQANEVGLSRQTSA